MIYETDPQKRMIHLYSQTKSSQLLSLPNLIFVIRYHRGYTVSGDWTNDNLLLYPGIWGCGLRVFCSKAPMLSFKDMVHRFYLEPGGVGCTDHTIDDQRYETPEKLVSEVIATWYNVQHYCGNYSNDGFSDIPNSPVVSLREAIDQTNKSWLKDGFGMISPGVEFPIPKKAVLLPRDVK